MDPLAELQPDHTPYHFLYNNPLSFIDPTGMAPSRPGTTMGEDWMNSEGRGAELGMGSVTMGGNGPVQWGMNGARQLGSNIYRNNGSNGLEAGPDGNLGYWGNVRKNTITPGGAAGEFIEIGSDGNGGELTGTGLMDVGGQMLNAGGVVWGAAQLYGETANLRTTAYNISKSIGYRSGDVYRALKGTLNTTKSVSGTLGTLGFGISALSYGAAVYGPQKMAASTHANFGISTALYGAAFFTAGTVAAPFVGGTALIYGTVQLGSYLYNGKTLEQNIMD